VIRISGLFSGLLRCLPVVLCLVGLRVSGATGFTDPLDMPAAKVQGVERRSMLALSQAGPRWVAVGLRGLIAVSDDDGSHWRQVAAPVSSDLTSVHFPNADLGWAVGHDGVILHSNDGGLTWRKQFDGRRAAEQFAAHYQRLIDAGQPALAPVLRNVAANYQGGPSVPFLGVWFEDAQRGFAVGSFGTLVVTTDGGQHWTPAYEQVDNPQFFNLNAVRGIGGELYLASERGTVFQLERGTRRFFARSTGYSGSWFGLAGQGDVLVAYGLRGSVYASHDRAQTWQRVDLPAGAAVMDGDVSPDGKRMLLVTAGGQWLSSTDGGLKFQSVRPPRSMPYTGVRLHGEHVLLSGIAGVRVLPWTAVSEKP